MFYKIKHYFWIYLCVASVLTLVLLLCMRFVVPAMAHIFYIDIDYLVLIVQLVSVVYDTSIIFNAIILSFLGNIYKKKIKDVEFLTSIELVASKLNVIKAILIALVYALIYSALSLNIGSLGFALIDFFVLGKAIVPGLLAVICIPLLYYFARVIYLPNIYLIAAMLLVLEKIKLFSRKEIISE